MPANPPYIPTKDADLGPYLLNASTLLTAAPATYGLVAGDAVALAAVVTPLLAALVLATNPATRTAVTIAAKDTAKSTALNVWRPLAQQISQNASVDPADQAAIGVTIRSSVRTPNTPPTDVPVLNIDSLLPNIASIRYRSTIAPTSKAKPDNVGSLQIVGTFGATFTTDPDAAPLIGSLTKSPFTLPTPGQSGKKMTLWGRWVNARGSAGITSTGPWSVPLEVDLP